MDLQEAVLLIQDLEPKFAAEGHHLGLTGSVLFKGESAKDVDLVVYPHNTEEKKFSGDELREFLDRNGFHPLPAGMSDMYHFDKEVVVSYRGDQRVDWFLLS